MLLFQGYNLANQLGHSIIKPVPSLFTFKIDDIQLTELAGVIIFTHKILILFILVILKKSFIIPL